MIIIAEEKGREERFFFPNSRPVKKGREREEGVRTISQNGIQKLQMVFCGCCCCCLRGRGGGGGGGGGGGRGGGGGGGGGRRGDNRTATESGMASNHANAKGGEEKEVKKVAVEEFLVATHTQHMREQQQQQQEQQQQQQQQAEKGNQGEEGGRNNNCHFAKRERERENFANPVISACLPFSLSSASFFLPTTST